MVRPLTPTLNLLAVASASAETLELNVANSALNFSNGTAASCTGMVAFVDASGKPIGAAQPFTLAVVDVSMAIFETNTGTTAISVSQQLGVVVPGGANADGVHPSHKLQKTNRTSSFYFSLLQEVSQKKASSNDFPFQPDACGARKRGGALSAKVSVVRSDREPHVGINT